MVLVGASPGGAGTVVAPTGTQAAGCLTVAGVGIDLLDADLAFVGTAVNVRLGGRWATFAVEEIWKGDPGGAVVEVRNGTPDGLGPTDRSYSAGQRYLVFARHDGQAWTDSACSATRPWADLLVLDRPPGATVVSSPAPSGGGISPYDGFEGAAPLAWAGLAAGGIAAVAVSRRRRARPAA